MVYTTNWVIIYHRSHQGNNRKSYWFNQWKTTMFKSNGKPPCLIGDTSSNGGFPIASYCYVSLPECIWINFQPNFLFRKFQFSGPGSQATPRHPDNWILWVSKNHTPNIPKHRIQTSVGMTGCLGKNKPHGSFIFRAYNPYLGGWQPSFFMVLGSKGRCFFSKHPF